MTKTLEERFWEKVDKSGDCWLWTAKARTAFGYGVIQRGSKGEGVVMAHRLSYELANGSIPDGLCVLHSCDTPACVRPEHLHLGTRADNMREKAERGRQVGRGPAKKCRKGHEDWHVAPNGKRRCRPCMQAQRERWKTDNPHYYRDWSRERRAQS